jgi:hypothetical protein
MAFEAKLAELAIDVSVDALRVPFAVYWAIYKHHTSFVVMLVISLIGCIYNRCFRLDQAELVVTVGARTVHAIGRELFRVQHEKMSPDAAASGPAMMNIYHDASVGAKSYKSAKELDSYTMWCRFLAYAMVTGTAQELDSSGTSSFESVGLLLRKQLNGEETEQPCHDPIEEVKPPSSEPPAGPATQEEEPAVEAEPTPNESTRENIDFSKEVELIKERLKEPGLSGEVRKDIEILIKTQEELWGEKSRGRKVFLDGDRLLDIFGAIIAPPILEIIPPIAQTRSAELSSTRRHFKVLRNPVTKQLLKGKELHIRPEDNKLMNQSNAIMCEFWGKKSKQFAKEIAKVLENPPLKWGAQDREEVHGKVAWRQMQRQWKKFLRKIKGFTKGGEIQLPRNKEARAIGKFDAEECMEDAACIAPLERLNKLAFPHLVTKGKTLDENFTSLCNMLEEMCVSAYDLISSSDDLSAADSTVTVDDRERFRMIVNAVITPVDEYMNSQFNKIKRFHNGDFVVEAVEAGRKLQWAMRYIKIQIKAEFAILFSGERGTSCIHRMKMLCIEGAENIRMLGYEEGRKAFEKILDGTHKWCCGDGDDNLTLFPANRYVDGYERFPVYNEDTEMFSHYDSIWMTAKEKRMHHFALYHTVLEPCGEWGVHSKTAIELCSMYVIQTRAPRAGCPRTAHKGQYVHLVKFERNLGRVIAKAIRRNWTDIDHEKKGIELKDSERREILTDLWQRGIAAKHTMFLRNWIWSTFEYIYNGLKNKSGGTVYDPDRHRLGHEDGDHTIDEIRRYLREALDNAYVSPYAMVRMMNFKNFSALTPTDIKEQIKMWKQAEQASAYFEFDEMHFRHPESVFDTLAVPSFLLEQIGCTKDCIQRAREREALFGTDGVPDSSQQDSASTSAILADVTRATSPSAPQARRGRTLLGCCGWGKKRDASPDLESGTAPSTPLLASVGSSGPPIEKTKPQPKEEGYSSDECNGNAVVGGSSGSGDVPVAFAKEREKAYNYCKARFAALDEARGDKTRLKSKPIPLSLQCGGRSDSATSSDENLEDQASERKWPLVILKPPVAGGNIPLPPGLAPPLPEPRRMNMDTADPAVKEVCQHDPLSGRWNKLYNVVKRASYYNSPPTGVCGGADLVSGGSSKTSCLNPELIPPPPATPLPDTIPPPPPLPDSAFDVVTNLYRTDVPDPMLRNTTFEDRIGETMRKEYSKRLDAWNSEPPKPKHKKGDKMYCSGITFVWCGDESMWVTDCSENEEFVQKCIDEDSSNDSDSSMRLSPYYGKRTGLRDHTANKKIVSLFEHINGALPGTITGTSSELLLGDSSVVGRPLATAPVLGTHSRSLDCAGSHVRHGLSAPSLAARAGVDVSAPAQTGISSTRVHAEVTPPPTTIANKRTASPDGLDKRRRNCRAPRHCTSDESPPHQGQSAKKRSQPRTSSGRGDRSKTKPGSTWVPKRVGNGPVDKKVGYHTAGPCATGQPVSHEPKV